MSASSGRRPAKLVVANRALAADEPETERWPLHTSALLVVAASGLLWILIIAAVLWLMP